MTEIEGENKLLYLLTSVDWLSCAGLGGWSPNSSLLICN